MDDPYIAVLDSMFLAENWSGQLVVRSGIDGRVANTGVKRYLELSGQHLTIEASEQVDDDIVALAAETTQSRVRISMAARHRVLLDEFPVKTECRYVEEGGLVAQDLSLELREGERHTVEKVMAFYTSRDRAISEPFAAARGKVRQAPEVHHLLARHVLAWDHLWKRCDVVIRGHERTALVLHLHLFHLLQSVSEHSVDLDTGIPARGLHGEAYRGHVVLGCDVRPSLSQPEDAGAFPFASAVSVAAAARSATHGPGNGISGCGLPVAERIGRP